MKNEILYLFSEINKLNSVERMFGKHTRRLVEIYNSDPMFHNGKKESMACRPCVEKVMQFFRGYIIGLEQKQENE